MFGAYAKLVGLLLLIVAIVLLLVLWYVWAWSWSVHTLLFVIFLQAGLRSGYKSYEEKRKADTHPMAYAALAQKRFGR